MTLRPRLALIVSVPFPSAPLQGTEGKGYLTIFYFACSLFRGFHPRLEILNRYAVLAEALRATVFYSPLSVYFGQLGIQYPWVQPWRNVISLGHLRLLKNIICPDGGQV